ncbi:MAG: 3'-5' exonuclease, partial [Alphaproteobacteria bacterium]|nr:3'-5' exonuclease [Alphaproteobacteria bacterium]
DDLLREAALKPESGVARSLTALVAAQGESGFAEVLKEAIKAARRLEDGELSELIKKTRGFLALDPEDTPESLRRRAMEGLPEAQLRQLATWSSEGKTYRETRKALEDFLALSLEERLARFDDYIIIFFTQKGEPRKALVASPVRKAHPEVDDICAAEVQRLSLALERIEAAETAETTEHVLRFGRTFAKRLAERKAARAALDYDDLIRFAEKLLRRSGIEPWVRYKLDNGLDHILLDESQDTSLSQWNIMESLSQEFYAGEGTQAQGNRTLFVVGDEKQSIFSFQNANPEAFLSRREFFARHFKEAGKPIDSVAMRTSFRSAQKVLDTVDAVFAQEAARISPDPIAHRAFPNPDGTDKLGRVEVWPLYEKIKPEKDESGDWIMPTSRETENDPQADLAASIAHKIRGWLSRHDALPGEKGPIAPGDIMILLRNRGRFADLMVRALKAAKVPVTGVDRMRLIDELPVMDLLSTVRFVLLPEDDLNLATLLRSPLLGLSEDQLMALAIGRKDSLWESLKGSQAFAEVRAYLTAKLNEADFATPFAFLSGILDHPCPGNGSSGRKALWARLGDEALDPIEELLNEAQRFSQSRPPSLQNFLHWLTRSDIEIKRELDHGEGQVRIMTVHASKGLEAPIVFLPDTVSRPQPQKLDKFCWAENGAPLFLARKPGSAPLLRLWQKAREKQMEEYRRLFYVAMTRASRRLYICGFQNGNDSKATDNWYSLAISGLGQLHQEFLPPEPDGPVPVIAFGDMPLSLALQPPPSEPKTRTPALPAWAAMPAARLEPPTRTAAPSSTSLSAATPDAAFARGRIIHRLLQSLPDVPKEKRAAAIERFLAQPAYALEPPQRAEIAVEIRKLIENEEFSALFSPDSLAEVAVTGVLGGATVFRQIDRLCLHGDEVWIVDYKTNRPPPRHEQDVPFIYRKQIDEYRVLLKGIYPDKTVRCFLLWTYAPVLMEVHPFEP